VATHSHATENFYASVPGLKVCTPATPRDAKDCLKRPVRDNIGSVLEASCSTAQREWWNPRMRAAHSTRESEVKREGSESRIICYSQTVPLALNVAAQLRKKISLRRFSICVRLSRSMRRQFRFGHENPIACDRRTRSSILCVGAEVATDPKKHFLMRSTLPLSAYPRRRAHAIQ